MLKKNILSWSTKMILISLWVLSQFNNVSAKENQTIFLTNSLDVKDPSAPIDETIALVAPHLPAIIKFQGRGVSFTYKKQVYLYEENVIKEWIKLYPQEFEKYNIEMPSLIKETKVSKLPKIMQAIFYDLKAQYFIIKKTTTT